jgi:hypothetical protein
MLKFAGWAGRLTALLVMALSTMSPWAAPQGGGAEADAAQANNPLAKATAFNLQNYYIGDLTGLDESPNQFWLRFAKPFSIGETSWLLRASLPVNTFPVPPTFGRQTGWGDLNVFAKLNMQF